MATGGQNSNATTPTTSTGANTNTPKQLIDQKTQDDLRKLSKAGEDFVKSGKALGDQLKRGKDTIGDIGGNIGKAVSEIKTKTSANAGMFGDKSIIGKASKNVFEFPVFMSSSVPIDFATAVNSLLEQIYASYLQMAISQTPIVSASAAKSGNIFNDMKSDVTKYLEYTDMFYAHDACHNIIETDDAVFEYHMIDLPDNVNKVIQEQLDHQPLSEFEHYFQEANTSTGTSSNTSSNGSDDEDFDAREIDRLQKEIKDLEKEQDELRDKVKTNIADQKERDRLADIKEEIKDAREALASARKSSNADAKLMDDTDIDEDGKTRQQRNEERAKAKDDREKKAADRDEKMWRIQYKKADEDFTRAREKHAVDMKAKAPQMLDETKIQKLNTMKPLMMSVGVKVMADDGSYVSDMIDYVVGVKTHCRVVPADVLPDVAEYPKKGQGLLSRKARWRAGEIKFLDYLFSRKDKKQAAYDSKDPNRKWYHRLYTLAHSKGSSKVAKKITGRRSPDGLIPNATLVMTKADVDMIEATNGIDLLKGSEAKSLCAEMFLIAMVVIDTDAQSIKILLPDVNNDYEIHSLASVNKQLATLDTSNAVSREVTKMMHGR